MELHRIRYFVSVARHLSFTKAAEENHVAQPSLSQQVQRLEQALNAKLFDRSGSPVRLTDVGRMLLPQAELVLKQIGEMQATAEEVLGLRAGRLVIGTPPMSGGYVLPPAVAEFQRRYANIRVILREETTAALIDLILRGETDLALVSLPINQPELDVQVIVREDIMLAVPPGHRLAGRRMVGLDEVAGEPFLLMKPGFTYRELCLQACRNAGFEPRITYESAQMDTIQSMVAVGLGVALVPRMATQHYRRLSPVYLEVVAPRITRELALAWGRNRHLPVAAQAFLEVAASVWACEEGEPFVVEALRKAQLKAVSELRQRRDFAGAPPAIEPHPLARKKRMSQTDMAYEVLLKAGHALHIRQIVEQIHSGFGITVNRDTLVSAVLKQVAQGKRFAKTGPNTFGLLAQQPS